jgi:hypothetical protein
MRSLITCTLRQEIIIKVKSRRMRCAGLKELKAAREMFIGFGRKARTIETKYFTL